MVKFQTHQREWILQTTRRLWIPLARKSVGKYCPLRTCLMSPLFKRARAPCRMSSNPRSKEMKAISDNAFWNSLGAKADKIIESVIIYIDNRIERDSPTLVAVGIFTLDRIRRDMERAVLAAGRQARRLLLTTNSSYAEWLLDQGPLTLPS